MGKILGELTDYICYYKCTFLKNIVWYLSNNILRERGLIVTNIFIESSQNCKNMLFILIHIVIPTHPFLLINIHILIPHTRPYTHTHTWLNSVFLCVCSEFWINLLDCPIKLTNLISSHNSYINYIERLFVSFSLGIYFYSAIYSNINIQYTDK